MMFNIVGGRRRAFLVHPASNGRGRRGVPGAGGLIPGTKEGGDSYEGCLLLAETGIRTRVRPVPARALGTSLFPLPIVATAVTR